MAVPEIYGGRGRRLSLQLDNQRRNSTRWCRRFGNVHHLDNDVCLPYFINYCNEEQADRWMPGLVDGSLMSAIAMTEPAIGSDLRPWERQQ